MTLNRAVDVCGRSLGADHPLSRRLMRKWNKLSAKGRQNLILFFPNRRFSSHRSGTTEYFSPNLRSPRQNSSQPRRRKAHRAPAEPPANGRGFRICPTLFSSPFPACPKVFLGPISATRLKFSGKPMRPKEKFKIGPR